jgi:hypothetical protein
MRKRKEHDAPSRAVPIGILAVALGLLLLGGFSVFGVWQLANIPPTNTPLPSLIPSPVPTEPPRPYPTPTLPLQNLPGKGWLVYSTIAQRSIGLWTANGLTMQNFKGEDPVISRYGRVKLVYTRDKRLYMDAGDPHGEVELAPDIPGEARMPAWSEDGWELAFVLHTNEQDAIYQRSMGTGDQQWKRLWVTQNRIVAPPQPVPGRERLLVVELEQPGRTRFYSISATCGSYDACRSTRQDIATVPFTVTWADYHPGGTFIGFTELQNGDLYQLATANGEFKLLIDDKVYKRRVAFSEDTTSLVYINRANELFVVDLEKPFAAQWLLPTDVASVDWAGK